MINLFVYGTLREGHGNHRLLSDSEKLGEATIPGERKSGLVVVPSDDDVVRGEVYAVDDETLRWVDRLEGYDPDIDDEKQGGYVRTPVTATLEDGEEVDAEVYYVRS